MQSAPLESAVTKKKKKKDTVPGLEALRINNTACKQTLQFGVRNAIIQGSLGTRD